MAVAKDQIRQIIAENNITSVADVYSLLKDSFKDILQELLEAEMDATLGYEKNCKGDLKSDNIAIQSIIAHNHTHETIQCNLICGW